VSPPVRWAGAGGVILEHPRQTAHERADLGRIVARPRSRVPTRLGTAYRTSEPSTHCERDAYRPLADVRLTDLGTQWSKCILTLALRIASCGPSPDIGNRRDQWRSPPHTNWRPAHQSINQHTATLDARARLDPSRGLQTHATPPRHAKKAEPVGFALCDVRRHHIGGARVAGDLNQALAPKRVRYQLRQPLDKQLACARTSRTIRRLAPQELVTGTAGDPGQSENVDIIPVQHQVSCARPAAAQSTFAVFQDSCAATARTGRRPPRRPRSGQKSSAPGGARFSNPYRCHGSRACMSSAVPRHMHSAMGTCWLPIVACGEAEQQKDRQLASFGVVGPGR